MTGLLTSSPVVHQVPGDGRAASGPVTAVAVAGTMNGSPSRTDRSQTPSGRSRPDEGRRGPTRTVTVLSSGAWSRTAR